MSDRFNTRIDVALLRAAIVEAREDNKLYSNANTSWLENFFGHLMDKLPSGGAVTRITYSTLMDESVALTEQDLANVTMLKPKPRSEPIPKEMQDYLDKHSLWINRHQLTNMEPAVQDIAKSRAIMLFDHIAAEQRQQKEGRE